MTKPLSPESMAIVKATAPVLVQHGVAITTRMYERLFVDESIKALFDQAATLSADRNARMLELQALTRLATIRHGGPGESETRARLRDVYETFTEGFTTPPLQAAAAILAGDR